MRMRALVQLRARPDSAPLLSKASRRYIIREMRFYLLPIDQGITTCINFDHVASIRVTPQTIELHFAGVETPMVIAKTPTTLATIAKGMDLSDSSKDLVNAL